MLQQLKGLGESKRWWLMVNAAKRGFEQQGGKLSRRPGRGLSNIFDATNADGTTDRVSIRTSMDRWLAFPPLNGGKKWKTLDDVDRVLVATLDNAANPNEVVVHLFPADEVRKRFNEAYKARAAAGHVVKDNYGMWVGLDPSDRGLATDVGSGLAAKYPPIATFPVAPLIAEATGSAGVTDAEDAEANHEGGADGAGTPVAPDVATPAITIADVIRSAKASIAKIAGVKPEAVVLELRLGV